MYFPIVFDKDLVFLYNFDIHFLSLDFELYKDKVSLKNLQMDQNRNEVSITISNHSSLNKGNRLNPNKIMDQLINMISL